MSPPAIRRRLYVTALLMDTAFFCGWATVPFLVKRGDALQLDDADLGTLAAVTALVYVLGALTLAPAWQGRSRVMITRIAGIVCGLGFVGAALVRAPWQLFVVLAVGRLGLSAFWPNLMALVGEAPGKTLVARIGSFNCWWSSGKAIAFLCCGGLLSVLEPSGTLLVCGGVAAIAALCVPSVATAVSAGVAEGEERGRPRFFVIGLAGVFVAWAIAAIWENQFPKGLGVERFGPAFGADHALWVNVLLFCLFAGQAAGFFVLRAWQGWPTERWTLLLAAVLVAGSQAGALFSTAAWLTGALLFVGGLGFAVFYAQSLYHAQAGSRAKVRRSAIHEGALNLGFVIGPPAAGYAAWFAGRPTAPFELCVGLALTSLVVVFWIALRGPSSESAGA